jgi:hypothetical protein
MSKGVTILRESRDCDMLDAEIAILTDMFHSFHCLVLQGIHLGYQPRFWIAPRQCLTFVNYIRFATDTAQARVIDHPAHPIEKHNLLEHAY